MLQPFLYHNEKQCKCYKTFFVTDAILVTLTYKDKFSTRQNDLAYFSYVQIRKKMFYNIDTDKLVCLVQEPTIKCRLRPFT